MKTQITSLALTLALAFATGTRAESVFEKRKPATSDGTVRIENPGGTTRVTGWDKTEILVRATLGNGASGVRFDVSGGSSDIEVEATSNPMGANASLEISVPAASRVTIESVQGTVTVAGVRGTVSAETVNGSIEVAGGAKEVDLHAVNGRIDVGPGVGRIKAEAVNGNVTIREALADVEASTVNGTLSVTGRLLEHVELETVAGALRLEAGLAKTASVRLSSVSGSVEIALPTATGVAIAASTFSGSIENSLSADRATKARWNPAKELDCTLGSGGARLSVETLSGSIRFVKKEQ